MILIAYKEIKITLISNDKRPNIPIPIENLLKPLNDVNNLVYFLSTIHDRESRASKLPFHKNKIDFITFPLTHRPRIRDNKEAVKISSMEMKSPYIVNLIINGFPYVIEVITILLSVNQDEALNKLVILFDKWTILTSLNLEQKRKVAKRIITVIYAALGVASIKICS